MVRTVIVAVLIAALGMGAPGLAMAQTTPRPGAKPQAKKPVAPAPAAPTPPPPPAPPSDVKVVTSYTQGAQVSVNTTYLSDGRQRVEFPGLVAIGQCDLKRTVLVSPAAKRYRVQPDPVAAPPAVSPTSPFGLTPNGAEIAAALGGGVGAESPLAGFVETGGLPIVPGGYQAGQTGAPQKNGVVTITTTLADTLERQTMFGLEARRIKTTVTRQATGDVCDKTALRTEIDAWYVDLPKTASSCGRTPPAAPEAPVASGECRDRTETHVVGDVTLGFPVKTVTTNLSGEGDKQESSTTSAEVTSLEITRLDRALFEVPANFIEAKSALELAPAMATGSSLADVLFGSIADGSSTATVKAAGVTRIGVLEPVNTSARGSLRMRALRQELVAKLTKGPFEAVPLGGSAQVSGADAARFECDYVLATDVTDVKTSKPGKLSGVTRMTGGGPPKDRQEVKMAYRLYPADGTATIKLAGDVKADNGGGFSIGSALRVAAFAGQLYMTFGGMGMMNGYGGMGGMGMGMGMMNPMFAMSRGGGMGAMGSSFFDPRSMAMSSMAMGFGGMSGLPGLPGMGDPSEAEVSKVVSKALDDIAKATTDKLKSTK